MGNIRLFILRNCPFCIQALDWQRQLMEENPKYRDVAVEIIDEREQAELANSYDYYYVPTYYLDDKKMHEGVATKKKIAAIFETAVSKE